MINTIKKRIMKIEHVAVGTLLVSYRRCGKSNCLCMINKKNEHGPYYIMTRKHRGKTITKSLTLQQAKLYRKALQNMKRLNLLLEKWKLLSQKCISDSE